MVGSLNEMPNSSQTHCIRSISRQRTTPWDRSTLDNTRERLTLVIVQLGRVSRRLAADQPVRAAGVEAQHPIANDLKADATDLGRLRPPPTVIDHRQRQKPARLTGVLHRPGQRGQASSTWRS